MLIVVRHGRTDANARGLLLGRADPSLDDVGRAQARNLAGAVGKVDRVVSSPLARCRETAECLGDEVELDERWIELDYGEYDGALAADVPTEVWQAWRADLDYAPPHGESKAAMALRVRAALDDLTDAGKVGDIAVVTHVSPIKIALAWALGAGDQVSWRAFVGQASVMRIGITEHGPVLRSFNEVGHLAG